MPSENRNIGRPDQPPRENGHTIRADDRDRYSTERAGYGSEAEEFDEKDRRSRTMGRDQALVSPDPRHEGSATAWRAPEPEPRRGAPESPSPSRGGYDPQARGASESPSDVYQRRNSEEHRKPGRWFREPLAVSELMTRDVKTVTKETSVADLAALMRDEDVGVVPVVDESGMLVGIVTDRDIVVRAIAPDKSESPREIRAGELATKDVDAVSPNDSIVDVLHLMGRRQIRRTPVVGENRRLVGMISLGDIAGRADYDEELQDALGQISARRSFWSRIWR